MRDDRWLPPAVKPAPPLILLTLPQRPARIRPCAPSAPLLVKLYTDDPDVVIYWLIEKKGD